MHRHCDLIEIANRSNLADSFCSGIIQTDNSSLFKTPTYYAQQLYAIHAGRYPLRIQGGAVQGDPALDVSATLSADEKRLTLFAVNPTGQVQRRTIDLTGLAPPAGDVDAWTLADTAKAGQRDAANSLPRAGPHPHPARQSQPGPRPDRLRFSRPFADRA